MVIIRNVETRSRASPNDPDPDDFAAPNADASLNTWLGALCVSCRVPLFAVCMTRLLELSIVASMATVMVD